VTKPVEECDLEPQKTCRHVTKLVPYLRAVEECVDVPQEVCGVSRVDPVKKKRPSIQWWCVDEPDELTPTTSNATTTTTTTTTTPATTSTTSSAHSSVGIPQFV